MFVKLAVLALSVAVASAAYNGPLAGGLPAAQYPAGVDPHACPNYPLCDNPAVAVNQVPASQFASQYRSAQPQYNQQYQPQAYAQQQQYNPNPVPVQQYNNLPQYNQYSQPQYSGVQGGVQEALNRGEYIGDGDYHGEGLQESGAYGNQGASAYNRPQAYARSYNPVESHQGHGQNLLPAGVSAASCPNYPYCS